MSDSELGEHGNAANSLTAVQAADAMARGMLTSEQLVNACLARMAERDGDVQAFAHFDAQRVLSDARSRDAARTSGGACGPLFGIPVAIKDIIDTVDYPTENGTAVFAGRQPKQDASLVAQLKAAGAIIFGKTVTTELAFFGPGQTRNPHDAQRTPGGSSSGSAAAVADFQVPLAIGTQTAGSLIRPASYCGVIGFKPTFGAVSRAGVLAQSAPLDSIGGYARSIADIAVMIDAISAFDPADGDMTPGKMSALSAALGTKLTRPPRLAFVKSPAWDDADPQANETFEQFIAAFGKRLKSSRRGCRQVSTAVCGCSRSCSFPTSPRITDPLPMRMAIVSRKS